MIKYREGYEIDYIRLIELLEEAGQNDVPTDYKHLSGMVEGSKTVVTAWDFDYMVGFARLPGDEDTTGRINIIVDNEYKEQGIEEELRKRIGVFFA
ncbi:MAG TPA: hypothetical protein GXZ22_05560 [Clostridiaceae bacterium]|jgi:hypothetical protein|nr:hypothetical protein [Clostridiaceae bacterium]